MQKNRLKATDLTDLRLNRYRNVGLVWMWNGEYKRQLKSLGLEVSQTLVTWTMSKISRNHAVMNWSGCMAAEVVGRLIKCTQMQSMRSNHSCCLVRICSRLKWNDCLWHLQKCLNTLEITPDVEKLKVSRQPEPIDKNEPLKSWQLLRDGSDQRSDQTAVNGLRFLFIYNKWPLWLQKLTGHCGA